MNSIVNFFIVGYPKAGTTTLHNFLKEHPQIFLPTYKETKFFATDLQRESDSFHGGEAFAPFRTIEEYHGLYAARGQAEAIGDVTPQYIYSQESAEKIYQYNPSAKIVIVIREPVAFLRSLHSEFLARLNEEEEDLFSAMELETSRRQGKHIPATVRVPSYLYYSNWMDYTAAIKRYTSVFPPDQVKIVLFDDLVANEVEVAKEVMRFLNVDDGIYQAPEKINRNPSHTVRFRFLWKIAKSPVIYRLLKKIIPTSLYGRLDELAFKYLFKKQPRQELGEGEIQALKKKFAANVIEIDEYLREEGFVTESLCERWGYTFSD